MVRTHAEAMYSRDLTCQTLGISLDDVGPGSAVLGMRVSPTMVNGLGVAHGGYLFLLADTAFAYAANSRGPVTVAQSATVTFLRPVNVGDLLTATATERARQGRTGLYDVTVTRHGDGTVAEFRGHSATLTRNPAAV